MPTLNCYIRINRGLVLGMGLVTVGFLALIGENRRLRMDLERKIDILNKTVASNATKANDNFDIVEERIKKLERWSKRRKVDEC